MTRLDKDGLTMICNFCNKEYSPLRKPQTLCDIVDLCETARNDGWWVSSTNFAMCPNCLKNKEKEGNK